MTQEEIKKQINDLNMEMYQSYAKVKELKAQRDPELVSNYDFMTQDGNITLSQMFSGHNSLIVIHNMGSTCSWCTAWADGFSGIYHLISQHTAFYLTSPELPDQQALIKEERNWVLPMVSTAESDFNHDMGFKTETGYLPGLSVFTKEADQIFRIDFAPFGPSDNFGVLWHLYDLLPQNPMAD